VTAEEERQVLRDLLESDGWRLYIAQMGRAWGSEALEQQLSDELESAIADERQPITDTLLKTFRGVRRSLKWPEERLRQLTEGQTAAPAVLGKMHAAFKRARAAH
jgi:hypothetical protein